MKTYREIKYIFTHSFTTQKNIIFGQIHAPAALLPGNSPLNKSLSLDDVARVYLIFHRSVRSGLSAECVGEIWPGFYSGDKQWKPIHRDVASISKTCVLLPAYKQQACCAVRRYVSTYSRGQKSLRTYEHSSGTSVRRNCYLLFQNDQACTCTCTSTWVARSNICVTTVNIRNVFYYNIWICSLSTAGTVTFDLSI
jgi:hypothetical protein